MKRKLEIAIIVETSTSWGRQITSGISDYASQNGGWLLYLEPRGRYEEFSLPEGWHGDGIIGRITSSRLAEQIIDLNIPAVNVSCYEFYKNEIPICTCDEDVIGNIAAKHLIQCGLKNFAYVSDQTRGCYHDRVGESFISSLKNAAFKCSSYKLSKNFAQPKNWYIKRKNLENWLKELEKPVGLLAWNDVLAMQVTQACHHCNIRVPDDIAVMGGGIDELFGSTISTPPLTSIDPAARQVGYQAAGILEKMITKQPISEFRTLIQPVGIISRQSTNILAVDNEHLAHAVKFIRDNALTPIDVADVVKQVPLCRRSLEGLFRKKLGFSPLQEIRRIRMEHAKYLLINSYWPISEIANACCYTSSEIFSRAFTQYFNKTPLAYRKNAQKFVK